MRSSVFAALLLAFCASCVAPSRDTFIPTPAQARMVELVARRLDLAREVAWQKYLDDLPVLDRAREATLLASLVERGRAAGIDESTVATFFGAQIAASRAVQSDLIRIWSRGGKLPAVAPRRLVPDIRDDLDAVSAEMLRLLPATEMGGAFAGYAASSLRPLGFPASAVRLATAPLRGER